MKWMLLALGGIAGVVGVVALVGWLLPVGHTATARRRFSAAPEALWSAITSAEAFPSWRSRVKRVERLSDGRSGWIEDGSDGRMTLVIERSEPPTLLVLRIADKDLPFGGTWTYTITPSEGATELAITEEGEVYNPIFRFMSRFVFGHGATIDAYFSDLEKKLSAGASRT